MPTSSTHALAVLGAVLTLGCAAPAGPDAPEPQGAAEPASAPEPDPSQALPGVWEITEGPGAPFLLSPPAGRDPSAAVVLFVPGGSGIRDHALATFDLWLAHGRGREELWLLVPYSPEGDLSAEEPRVQTALERVLDEHAPGARAVHLAGTSNGGRTAFRWMLELPDLYASFLGAPALPPPGTGDEALVRALGGKPVMLTVGEEDAGPNGWLDPMRALHERLTSLGVACDFAVLPGEGHILSEAFDETPFFDFWLGRRSARSDASTRAEGGR